MTTTRRRKRAEDEDYEVSELPQLGSISTWVEVPKADRVESKRRPIGFRPPEERARAK